MSAGLSDKRQKLKSDELLKTFSATEASWMTESLNRQNSFCNFNSNTNKIYKLLQLYNKFIDQILNFF